MRFHLCHFDRSDFITNTDIEGYVVYSTPSNLSKGGTALYINDKFSFIERTDSKIQNDNFESSWVEIVNKLSRNIVVASIYRHPRYNLTDFISYLEKCSNILTKENKEIYLCGDFNIDLLQIETNNKYQQFYDMLCSYGFSPKIIQPTRVTVHTSSLIDNIFSNNIIDDTRNGNILPTLSEHFSQFLSVSRERLDYRNLTRFQHDYSKFQSDEFRDDVSIQNWNTNLNNANDLFHDFHFKLKGCVDRHAPIKQLKPKEVKLANKPWITPEISKMIKIRNKTFARKKRQPNNVNIKRICYDLAMAYVMTTSSQDSKANS